VAYERVKPTHPVQVLNIIDLTVSFKFLNFSFQIFLLFVPKMSASLICLYYLHCFGLDSVPAVLSSASSYLNLNILHQTTIYTASICTDLDSFS